MPNSSAMKIALRLRVSTNPSHAPLPNHMHGFDPLYRPPCRPEGTVALGQPGPFLYLAVVLLHNIVEILALTELYSARHYTFGFQSLQRRRIGSVSVHIHDPRHRVARSVQGSAEEVPGGSGVPSGGQQEIDGLASRVHGTIEILIAALNP